MREIKYRARHSQTGEWYYGSSLITDLSQGTDYELPLSLFWLQVEKGILDPETVGQYTGLKDKNSEEIYAGDIVSYSQADICRTPAEVYWEETGCQFRLATGGDRQFDKTRMIQFSRIGEVIGTIYENPELLGVKDR